MSDQDLIRFTCPHCGKRLKAKPKALGSVVSCPNPDCGEAITVPSSDRQTAGPGGQHAVAEITSLISMLGRRDLLGPPTHWHKLVELGDRAIPHLLPLLDSNDVNVVADAAKLLGQLGAKQAIPKLQALSKSRWAEVQQASQTALATLDSKGSGGLQLDRQNPYQQISRLWTAIFQGRQRLYPPDVLHAWAVETIAAMPRLPIPEEKKAQGWSMLGSLYYKSVQPEWDGDPNSVKPCTEAKKCYDEAVRINSGVDHWNKLAQNFGKQQPSLSASAKGTAKKCGRCGAMVEQLIPLQLRAAGSSKVVDIDVCADCLADAAKYM